MSIQTKTLMTIDDFHVWLEARRMIATSDEPKWELVDGVPVMQQSQRKIHARVKYLVTKALEAAIAEAGLALEVDVDGLGVKISAHREYVPEVIVYPRGSVADNDLIVSHPMIVVEVLSPSSVKTDLTTKVAGYEQVSSIEHYLVVDPDARQLMHFRRQGGVLRVPGAPVAKPVLRLDPPGLALPVEACFPH
jgi:Uma2 family endonuclease